MSSLGTFKNEVPAELKNVRYNDPEDMVYRYQLTYDEEIDIKYLKYIPTSTIGYTLPRGIFEILDISFMLKSLLPQRGKSKYYN